MAVTNFESIILVALVRMVTLLFSIVGLISCAFYLHYSGVAEGYVSHRSVLMFPILISYFVGFASLVKVIWLKFVKKRIIARPRLLAVAFAFYIGGIFLMRDGNRRDFMLIEKTQVDGDRIMALVLAYKEKYGNFPDSLNAIATMGNEIPKPSLPGSEFRYRVSETGEPTLSFNSVMFMDCWRTLKTTWMCDD